MIVSELSIYPLKSCQGIKLKKAEVTNGGFLWDRQMMLVTQSGKFLTQRQFPQLAKVRVKLEKNPNSEDPPDPYVYLSTQDNSLEPLTLIPTNTGEERKVKIWGDETIAIDQGDEVANWFHRLLELPPDKRCRLVKQSPLYVRKVRPKYAVEPDNAVSFADGYPFLVTTTASLAELNNRIVDTYQGIEPQVSMDRFRSNIVIETEKPFDEDNWKRIKIGDIIFAVVKPCSRCIITTVDQKKGKMNQLKEPLRTLGTFRQFGEQGVMFGENMISCNTGFVNIGDRVEVLEYRDR